MSEEAVPGTAPKAAAVSRLLQPGSITKRPRWWENHRSMFAYFDSEFDISRNTAAPLICQWQYFRLLGNWPSTLYVLVLVNFYNFLNFKFFQCYFFLSVIIFELEISLLGWRINWFYSKQDFKFGRQGGMLKSFKRKVVLYFLFIYDLDIEQWLLTELSSFPFA